jgi:hypothetical protein
MTENASDPKDSAPGTIYVNSIPAGVAVQLDGKDTGKVTPVVLDSITPGRHRVGIDLPDHCPISKEVTIAAGASISVCLRKRTERELASIRRIGYYTVSCAVILVGVAIFNRLYLTAVDDLTQLVIYIACSGGLGSLAYSMYGYIDHNGKGDFDLDYAAWYYVRPFIGIIYGVFAFLFVAGGLMTLSGASTDANLFLTKTVMFYCALSFLAGYAEHSFSLQLKELAEALFKKEENSQETQGK